MPVCKHTYIHTHTYIHAYIHTCMHTHYTHGNLIRMYVNRGGSLSKFICPELEPGMTTTRYHLYRYQPGCWFMIIPADNWVVSSTPLSITICFILMNLQNCPRYTTMEHHHSRKLIPRPKVRQLCDSVAQEAGSTERIIKSSERNSMPGTLFQYTVPL